MVFAKELSSCPFSAVIDTAESFMREHPELEVHAPMHLSAIVGVIAHRVDDHTDDVRKHEALEFSWKPRTPLLPEMLGLLTVRPHGPPGSEVSLTCWYTPPLDDLGRAFDATIGNFIAHSTVKRLLHEIVKHADSHWMQQRSHS